jgi:hypothetical protein
MQRIETSVNICALKEVVFAFFTDFENSPQVLHSAFKIEFLSKHREGLWVKWSQLSGDPDEPIDAINEIVSFERPHRYVMTTDNSDSFERMALRFEDLNSGTKVSFSLLLEGKSFWKKMMCRLASRIIRSYMTEDLMRMKAAIESGVIS